MGYYRSLWTVYTFRSLYCIYKFLQITFYCNGSKITEFKVIHRNKLFYCICYTWIDWLLSFGLEQEGVGVWLLAWRWHILSFILIAGRRISTETCVVQYWWSCTPSQSIGLFWAVRGFCVECHLLFSLVSPIVSCSMINKYTRMLVTIGICLKKIHVDTRYFAFCNFSPPMMLLPLDLLSEYWIQHGTIGPLCVTSRYSSRIFYRGVSCFATDCPCGVWCRGLTISLLYIRSLLRNRFLTDSWAVGLT